MQFPTWGSFILGLISFLLSIWLIYNTTTLKKYVKTVELKRRLKEDEQYIVYKIELITKIILDDDGFDSTTQNQILEITEYLTILKEVLTKEQIQFIYELNRLIPNVERKNEICRLLTRLKVTLVKNVKELDGGEKNDD
ncbi:hypothetical protein KQ51_01393 [Candidatus Izimaplasma bacterium HR1]|jgi:CRISPR/Cas system CSM-associated protein Csm2 small subunit|uniref:hypothetical protein n=1 Tax=Candidatus Izimoplasma sp. HR1 TaxID=1541959 RepID=UPI0004F7BB5B|nr:hypothetical protein KQ51_01393 [Candidatus Izimaplasma bacterium HR1]